jgi:gamma-glutamyltranspeptidase
MATAVFPTFHFASRRSVVHGLKGIVASPQPLATQVGIQILQAGGNAAVCTHLVKLS